MTETDKERIADRVVSKAKDLEEIDSVENIDPLGVYFEVTSDGTVKEAIAVLCTGGPKIEVKCFSGTVIGYWGEKHTAPILKNEDTLKAIGRYYTRRFEENQLA
jgi:hypothetical protein